MTVGCAKYGWAIYPVEAVYVELFCVAPVPEYLSGFVGTLPQSYLTSLSTQTQTLQQKKMKHALDMHVPQKRWVGTVKTPEWRGRRDFDVRMSRQ